MKVICIIKIYSQNKKKQIFIYFVVLSLFALFPEIKIKKAKFSKLKFFYFKYVCKINIHTSKHFK